MVRIVVTGTDTNVGKSVVTACLAQAARDGGRRVIAAKPVASGVPAGEWGEDATLIADAAGHEPLVRERYVAPLSPHRAAELEGRRVDVDGLRTWLASLSADVVLVEGVGGWRAPLVVGDPGEGLRSTQAAPTVIGIPEVVPAESLVVVVALDRLGVLNHTLLTVEAVRRDGFDVLGVVLNRPAAVPGDESHATNLDDLRRVLDVPVVAVPRIDPTSAEERRRAGQDVLRLVTGR